MFRILGLFRACSRSILIANSLSSFVVANRQQYEEPETAATSLVSAPGERLVRIPLDEVQVGNAKPS